MNAGRKAKTLERELRFAEIYMGNGENGTRAYMEVYDTTNEQTAAVQASILVRKHHVADYIQKRRAEMLAAYSLTPERLYREVARLAYFDPAKLFDADGKPLAINEIDPDTRAAISALEIEIRDGVTTYRARHHDKNAALEKGLKLLRLYDAPPLPPADETGNPRDSRETAKWLAFILARQGSTKLIEHDTESK